MKVYAYKRHEYKKELKYLGEDEHGEVIFEITVTYTGETPVILYPTKDNEHLCKGVPEWRTEFIGEYNAEKGHTKNGSHKFLYNRQPITIL